MKSATLHSVSRWARALVAGLLGWVALPGAGIAAPTEIANAPLFTSAALTVYPNIMFIMDNSGSMAFNYLPDAAGDFGSNSWGAASAHCNGLAYNPSTVYTVPVDSSGNKVAAPDPFSIVTFNTNNTARSLVSNVSAMPGVGSSITFTLDNAARTDYVIGDAIAVFTSSKYFAGLVTDTSWASNSGGRLTVKMTVYANSGSGSLNSATAAKGTFPQYYTYRRTGSQAGTQDDLGFAYDKSKTDATPLANTFYNECKASVGSGNKFNTVTVSPASDEAQNYANWQAFYSTRMEMMRSSMKLAFKNVTDNYRVGYTTINNYTSSSNFLDIGKFTQNQKDSFYAKLDNAVADGGTPLRGALSRAGQYFANQVTGQKDPVQYACQRNFTILSTDGYWNVGGTTRNDPKVEVAGYGPYKLNNTTTVGQQDGVGQASGTTSPPMYDGTSSTRASNTLADIAMYYYMTDLRTSDLGNCQGAADDNGVRHDVCDNKVPGSSGDAFHSFGDNAKWQHMTTFTIGLGVAGYLNYDPAYLTARSGDFFDIVNGNLNWPKPDTSACGACSSMPNADDLWHAAVNGRGQYFSASEPGALARGLNAALNSIKGATGAAAAASTSSLQPVAGDNDIFVAQFSTMEWTGDVLSYDIDPDDGSIGTTATWSAKTELDKVTPSSRKIYYSNGTAGGTKPQMKTFTYDNLKTDKLNGWFDNFCGMPGVATGATAPDQCATLGTDDLKAANDGSNLVAYLRGDQTLIRYYRERKSRLGDIINASPLFIGKPSFKYVDTGYDTFKADQASRSAVVLAAANDGMLHAFSRTDGTEKWAFIPSFVLPNLYKLADTNYANNHQFYVDGSPQMGDINVDGTWKTIVVGGLNSGGRGYYALDVTNPLSPTLLWEFTNANLGLSYGNPVITKRDNKWVVVFASGYNNTSGDGNGHLFVLDAYTGELQDDIATFTSGTTAAGTAANPSGLARINVWVDEETDNTEKRFYGGDLMGNLWRFTIDSGEGKTKGAMLLAQFKTNSTTTPATKVPESITSKPMLAEVTYNGVKYPVVYLGTGRYLGNGDLKDTTVQAIYAIKDPLTATGWGDVRAGNDLVVRTITTGTDASGNPTRTVSSGTVDWSGKAGWRADLPGSGERVSVNPQLALDTIYIGTNVPSSDSCEAGGTSFLYQFDITTGNGSASYIDQVLVQGLTLIQLVQGASAGAIEIIVTRSDGKVEGKPGKAPPASNTLHRTSWRELVD